MRKRKRINLGLLLTILTVIAVTVLVIRADKENERRKVIVNEKMQQIIEKEANAAIFPAQAIVDQTISDQEFSEATANAKRIVDELYTDEMTRARRLGFITESLTRQRKGDLFLTKASVAETFVFNTTAEGDFIRAEYGGGTLKVEADQNGRKNTSDDVRSFIVALFQVKDGEPVIIDLDGKLPQQLVAAFDPAFLPEEKKGSSNRAFGGFGHDFK